MTSGKAYDQKQPQSLSQSDKCRDPTILTTTTTTTTTHTHTHIHTVFCYCYAVCIVVVPHISLFHVLYNPRLLLTMHVDYLFSYWSSVSLLHTTCYLHTMPYLYIPLRYRKSDEGRGSWQDHTETQIQVPAGHDCGLREGTAQSRCTARWVGIVRGTYTTVYVHTFYETHSQERVIIMCVRTLSVVCVCDAVSAARAFQPKWAGDKVASSRDNKTSHAFFLLHTYNRHTRL
jgi:hypothetical protein